MAQSQGYVDPAFPKHVCLLHNALYGLKQAPKAWFERFTTQLLHTSFYASNADGNLFIMALLSLLVLLLYLPIVMLIRLGIQLIINPIQVLWFSLGTVQLLGLLRNKQLFLGPQQRLSIVPQPLLPLSYVGFVCFFMILVFFFLSLLYCGVTMSVLWPLPRILYFTLGPNTLESITILFVRRCSGVFSWLSLLPLMISLLIFLPRVFLLPNFTGSLLNSCGNSPFV